MNNSLERFKELLLKEGEHTDHECAELVSLGYYHAHKFRGEEEVSNIMAKAMNRVVINFREILDDYKDSNGNHVKAMHPFKVDYYSSIEGTLANKLKS